LLFCCKLELKVGEGVGSRGRVKDQVILYPVEMLLEAIVDSHDCGGRRSIIEPSGKSKGLVLSNLGKAQVVPHQVTYLEIVRVING
jgi:hypothetical protein